MGKELGPGNFRAQREQLVGSIQIAKRLSILLFAVIIVHHIGYIGHSLKGTSSDLDIALSESLSLTSPFN